MAFAVPFAPALGGLAGMALSSIMKKSSAKGKAAQQPIPVPTVNAAAEAARRDDELRRRRGAGANELTGGGAEATTYGGKTLLGQ